MLFRIVNRWNASVIFEADTESLKLCVELAVGQGVSLRGADLCDANLSAADLRGADLRYADLSAANLSYADLRDADLRDADLRDADLRAANLSAANLRGANLSAANLRAADLSSANLRVIRDDFWAVISAEPCGIPYLRQALIDGKVDGSTYDSSCRQGCLVGSLAYGVQKSYEKLEVLKPNGSRPAERFFLGIRPGDTPENSQFAKIALEWIDSYPPLALMQLPEVVKDGVQ